MNDLKELFDNNRSWASDMERKRPGFFTGLANQQQPRYMWIGCSDSRVPANEIIGLAPGEIFVHRNVANVVVHSEVEHIMVVGHYGCSGVQATLEGVRIGLADNWLRHVKDVCDRHRGLLDELPEHGRANALCELNVIEQVVHVAQSTVLQDAWARGQNVTLHGCVYGIHDGLMHDLHMTVRSPGDLDSLYREAVSGVRLMPRHARLV